ncbi:MAG: tetratricopeptide repeat protein [Sphingobacteriales bacterium]|nr:MAG: tetratricopeptide repeat protein [Sphingobacteriales bacterium]
MGITPQFPENRSGSILLPLVLAVVTVLAYLKVFSAGFISWDDTEYVLNNPDIRAINGTNLKLWFSSFYVGNYHPLTMFSYAIDWMIGKEEATVYHTTNLVLHVLNGLLVFSLFRKISDNVLTGFFVALLFALHPVQTESVSWVAERKNLLYGFFYLLAMHSWLRYIGGDEKHALLALLFGLGSMLAKPAALALPFSLLALDIWMKRDLRSIKVWSDKTPFLVMSVVFGIVGLKAQEAGSFLNLHPEHGFLDQLIYGGYAYAAYLLRLVFPYGLSVLYPYPPEAGAMHYAGTLLSLLLVAGGIYAWKKRLYMLAGGFVFYSANIFLVLQFVSFGEVLMADRYLYLPCLGLFFPLVHHLLSWNHSAFKRYTVAGLAVAAGILMLLTFRRNDIWTTEINFWAAISDRYPQSPIARYSLGAAYMKEGRYREASQHIDAALLAEPNNARALYNKGVLLLREKKLRSALETLNRSLAIEDNSKARFTRALIYQQSGDVAAALQDASAVIEQDPANARAHFIKGDCLEQMNNIPGAISSYSAALALDDREPMFYMRRGIAHAKTGSMPASLGDLSKAIEISPGMADAYYWRGMVKARSGQEPCADLAMAARLNFPEADAAPGYVALRLSRWIQDETECRRRETARARQPSPACHPYCGQCIAIRFLPDD